MEHYSLIGKLSNNKIELGDWPIEHQDWSRFVSFPHDCCLWVLVDCAIVCESSMPSND